jgi:hypothetical protein
MNMQETTTMLEDRQVNVKAKLALLWVALMVFYIRSYAVERADKGLKPLAQAQNRLVLRKSYIYITTFSHSFSQAT